MKTIVLFKEDHAQLVLTPENDFERSVLKKYTSDSYTSHIRSGTYYECNGGWTRERSSEDSLIVVLESI